MLAQPWQHQDAVSGPRQDRRAMAQELEPDDFASLLAERRRLCAPPGCAPTWP